MDRKTVFKPNLGRFAATSEEERNKILSDRHRKNTDRATKSNMKILSEYLLEKGYPPLLEICDEALPDLFEKFYTDLRKMDGDIYKITSLKCIRAGINHEMKQTRNIDIILDTRFVKANEMFRGVTKQAKKQGKGVIKGTKDISDDDMEKIGQYFDHDLMNQPNPQLVQKCVLFYIIYFLCCRGREISVRNDN